MQPLSFFQITEKTTSSDDFVFYGNLKHNSGSVEHIGDNRTGDGDGAMTRKLLLI